LFHYANVHVRGWATVGKKFEKWIFRLFIALTYVLVAEQLASSFP
jgi:hypothetical protein